MKKPSKIFELILILILMIACWTLPASSHLAMLPKPVIIDTDVSFDDIIAMLYLLKREDIQVKLITVESVGTGNCTSPFNHIAGMLQLTSQKNIPIACPTETPLHGRQWDVASILKHMQKLQGTADLLPIATRKINFDAIKLMDKSIRESTQPVTILAIGPLTNIANLLRYDPKIKKNIRAIVIMGGAINVEGNLSDLNPTVRNKFAEWNIYLDAPAAKTVFTSNIPIQLVPLDVTNTLPITWDFYQHLKKSHHSPAADFVYALLQRNEKNIRSHLWFFWDPLAAVLATDQEIANWQTETLQVLQQPENSIGRIIVNNRAGNPVKVCQSVNPTNFQSLLLKTID
jgi:inosine-uridine nucleoside N-ribohydrolase